MSELTSTKYYFAYGSNINPVQMSTRCPDARFNETGCLNGYDFLINERGVATIIPREGSIVYGVVWEVSSYDIESLDVYEGVSQGLYLKQNDICINLKKEKILAFIYVANNQEIGVPRHGYLEKIIDNACILGFDPVYIDKLKKWMPE